jgi:ribosomal peptide maturation radical SAM protein 1
MNVLLVNMPFSVRGPSIGLSLLKAHARRLGFSARVEYLSIRFCHAIGADVYEFLANEVDCVHLPGDWVFSGCLSGRDDRRPHFTVPEHLFEGVLRARELADPFVEGCLETLDWEAHDLVGFATVFRQNAAALSLARRVKERYPKLPIIFGGANCEEEMGLQLHRSFPFVDYVCTGEGDVCFPELLQSLADGEPAPEIDGIVFRDGVESRYTSLAPERVPDLDSLPYPDYDDYFEQASASDPRVVAMETSRGCWWGAKHHCTFCGLNGRTMAFRRKESDRALDEVLYLLERHQAAAFFMVDNIMDMQYFKTFVPEITSRGLELDVFYEVKANLTRDQLRLLAEAGVRSLQPGIESFSTDTLQLMRKGTTALQNVQLLKWCREFGIKLHWNLLYGFPDEDPAEYTRMARFVESLHHLEPPQSCGPVRLDRFSPLFSEAAAFGLRKVRPCEAYEAVYGLPRQDLAKLAYFFDFEFADGREPRTYTHELREAVKRWRAAYGGFGLVYADGGEQLGIFDYRGAAPQRRLLSGPGRELYLFCEQNRPRDKIVRLAGDLGWSEGEADAFLESMVADGLMARADERYVGLAVRKRLRGEAPVEKERDRDQNPSHLLLALEGG